MVMYTIDLPCGYKSRQGEVIELLVGLPVVGVPGFECGFPRGISRGTRGGRGAGASAEVRGSGRIRVRILELCEYHPYAAGG